MSEHKVFNTFGRHIFKLVKFYTTTDSYSCFIISGNIRFLVPSSNWIAIGNVNGTLNMLDIRTGEILHHWKPADKWPLPVSE